MENDPRTQPLIEWNQRARENAENAIVSSMLESTLNASDPLASFSDWLLLAAGATASFVLANSEKLLPLLSKDGFINCGIFLSGSCIFGLLGKFFAIKCKIGIAASDAVAKTFKEHLENHQKEEEEIQENARIWGITLQSGIRMERILEEFLKPFPWLVRKIANRHINKNKGNPQIAHVIKVRNFLNQSCATGLQAIYFLGFVISAFIYTVKA